MRVSRFIYEAHKAPVSHSPAQGCGHRPLALSGQAAMCLTDMAKKNSSSDQNDTWSKQREAILLTSTISTIFTTHQKSLSCSHNNDANEYKVFTGGHILRKEIRHLGTMTRNFRLQLPSFPTQAQVRNKVRLWTTQTFSLRPPWPNGCTCIQYLRNI